MRKDFEEVERLANEILSGKIVDPEDIPKDLMGNMSYYLHREYSGEIYEGTFGEGASKKAMEFRTRLRKYAKENGIPLKSSMLSVDKHANELYEIVSELIDHANDYDDLTEYNRLYRKLIDAINDVKSDRTAEVLDVFNKYILCDDKYTTEVKGSESARFVDFVRTGLKKRNRNRDFNPESRARDLKYSFGAAFSSSSVGKQAGFITKQVCLIALGGALTVGALAGPITWPSIFGLVTAGICGVGVYKGFEDSEKSLKPNIKYPKFKPKPLFSRTKEFFSNFAKGLENNINESSERRQEKREQKKQSKKDNKGRKTNIRELGRVSDYDEQVIYKSCAQEVLDFADRAFEDGTELAVAIQMINNRLANQLNRLPKSKLRTDYYGLAAKFQKMCETKSKELGRKKNSRKQVKNFKSYLTREKGKFFIAGRSENERYAGWKVNSYIDDKYRKNGVSGRDQFYNKLINVAENASKRRGK